MLPNFLKRKPRVLTQLAVSEISAVDKAAAPGARIVLRKRDRATLRAKLDNATACLAKSVQSIIDDPSANKDVMLGRSFGQFLDHVNKLTGRKTKLADVAALHSVFAEPRRKNLDVSIPKAEDDEGYGDDNPDDDDAADGSHHAGDGGENGGESADQLERARRALKGNNMQTHSELMSAVVKRYGIVAFAKSVEKGDVRCSEFGSLQSGRGDGQAREYALR